MTEDNQHNAGEQQTPMQPQPLPGQGFVRPGMTVPITKKR